MRITGINNYKVVFNGIYYDRVRKIEKENSFFSKAYWNAEEIAENELKKEILDYQTWAAQREGEAEGLRNTLDKSKKNHKDLLDIKQSQLKTIEDKIKNDETLAKNLDSSIESQKIISSSLDKTIVDYNLKLDEQTIELNNINQKIEQVNVDKTSFIQKTSKELSTTLEGLELKHLEELTKLDAELNNLIETPDKMQIMLNSYKEDGFGAIAGFKEEKAIVQKYFGAPIVLTQLDQDAKIPNGVLFFGPDKALNEEFVKATANQYDCNFIKIDSANMEDEFVEKIYESIDLANENYQINNNHSIIFIPDFDKKVQKNSVMTETFKSLLDDIASEYHATIFASSLNPENIDDILLRDGRFDLKLPLKAQLNIQDFEDYLKYYLEPKLLAKINLKNYVAIFKELQFDGAFSINNLKLIFEKLIPDIKKVDLINFEKQKNLFKNL